MKNIQELLEISLKEKLNWTPKEELTKVASAKPTGAFMENIEKIAHRLETLDTKPPSVKEPTVLEKLTEHAALKQQLENLSEEKKNKIREIVDNVGQVKEAGKAKAVLKALGIGVPAAGAGAGAAAIYGKKKRAPLKAGLTQTQMRQQRLARQVLINRLLLRGLGSKKKAA